MNEKVLEDINSLMGNGPVLFSDVVSALRGSLRGGLTLASGRRWRNINERDLQNTLEMLGFHFARRTHGAGVAVYIYTEKFTQVTDWYGRVHEVHPY